jgi:thiamine biosynthesis lipoprotein
MSTYDTNSELSRFNAHADTIAVPVSAPLASVLAQALAVHQASGGSFDVTVGPLVDVWGFGPATRDTIVPNAAELDSIGQFVGSDKLQLRGGMLTKSDARVRVDLSAIAKGYGVDVVSDFLIARGLANHLVEIGGELRARGVNVRGEPFRVGIEEPDPDRIRVRLAVALDNRALASSGNYRNFYEVGGVRYSHTLDPITRRPTQHRLLAVSVLHSECALADAWATALMAAGPDGAWALAEANGLDVLLLIDGGDGRVNERATPGFTAALRRNDS